jgi:hypothetical protein
MAVSHLGMAANCGRTPKLVKTPFENEMGQGAKK